LRRALVLAVLWWAIAGEPAWTFGVPAVALAAGASLWLVPQRTPFRVLPALRFVAFFLWHSLRAGFDVARRALTPSLPLAPGIVEHRMRLPAGLARVIFVNTVSLLPGTLSVEVAGERLRVHALDARLPVEAQLRNVEARIAAIFG
jgi:multicomponent Na+:H+ antiporter subunit E